MKQLIRNTKGWWVVQPSTGNNAIAYWTGPYRWRWLAALMRRWR